ncbi:MAG: OpgC domain-containing protein [Candidatus Hydrogenedentes bacterium]|nr:OpgC domain-containing protein [Candidatus Hydrogenedentota bacterium]
MKLEPEKSSSSSRSGAGIWYRAERLTCLDEVRAVAICAMMLIHFGEGFFEHVPQLAFIHPFLRWSGRFATPAFVTIFGVTAGFVYFEKLMSGQRQAVDRKLLRRVALLILCAAIIRVPHYGELVGDGNFEAMAWLFGTYSILAYYTLGVATVPVWLRIIQRRPVALCLVLGILHWVIGTIIVFHLWPQSPELNLVEFVRLYVVSGSFAYLQLSGTALLGMAIGVALRRSLKARDTERLLAGLFVAAVAMVAVGWAWGTVLGEYNTKDIIDGALKAPPRPWYFLFFAGFTVLLLATLGLAEYYLAFLQRIRYPVCLFGQASLPIFTGHVFVLPALKGLDHIVVLDGIVRVLVPFAMFGVYCLAMMYRRHLKLQMGKPGHEVPRWLALSLLLSPSGPRTGKVTAEGRKEEAVEVA